MTCMHVARALGVLERTQIVRVVGDAIALVGRDERHDRVRGPEGLSVADARGDLKRPTSALAALLEVAAEPLQARIPGEQERLVPGRLAVETPAFVDGNRLVQVAAQVVDQADAPGQPWCEIVSIRGPRVPGKRVLPLTPDLPRPSGEQHDRRVQRGVGEELRVADDSIDGPGREHRLPTLGEQGGKLLVGARSRERAERVLHEALGLQPCRRAGENLRLVGERHALACELAHQRSE